MPDASYALIVIGGGPTGYIAAERAGHDGLKTLLIEDRDLGGVCLNEGCIPSKAMLNAAKIYHNAVHGDAYGVIVNDASFDIAKLNAHKASVQNILRKGVAGIMKRAKVDVVNGLARLTADRKVAVNGDTHDGANILIATGSSSAAPPIPGADLDGVLDSTGVLNLDRVPTSAVIIGGGVIGCEFACFFGSIGVPTTVIEMLPEICPVVDADIAKTLRTELSKKNITFHTGATVKEIKESSVTFSIGDETLSVDRDIVLVATGRRPNVSDLGLEDLRVDFDKGGIKIDDRCATNVPGVWAGGDVTGKVWLAHAGSRMGEVVVNNIAGRPDQVRYDTIPGVIYTNPEVATVGLTEAAATERGIPVKAGKMPLSANGRFLAEHPNERGMVKVVTNAESGALLGVHMVGGACSEMIYGAAAMIEAEYRVKEIRDVVFPHPTTSEIIRDTLLAI